MNDNKFVLLARNNQLCNEARSQARGMRDVNFRLDACRRFRRCAQLLSADTQALASSRSFGKLHARARAQSTSRVREHRLDMAAI